ncbi:bifunctional ADP-dependent NAD(P)H-hydrate dehydratase/NAD(P)H-hydrate epimerase [Anditalea andensis]|uniref:Bifunctional NAD(P)H-hydrate repair enzyme n=1 Tax=Anditalea andensis TaxID=1048983 RepID=A0A074KV21_9BACT|nr:bifunctional ADP-dependent NAD(P)H-hydrate dehydratase/NAD(P)H-hydrate epimerase [Anditalea andensis]KEO72754.1 hydroxyethylthiazole kinase [Anditalea andensis]
MLKIISGKDVNKLDLKYIKAKGILSFELMEKAAEAFCEWYMKQFDRKKTIAIFCGIGNNGGDGLAIARMLFRQGYKICVFLYGDADNASSDFKSNLRILPSNIVTKHLNDFDLKKLETDIVIDALLGVGINKPLEGQLLGIVQYLSNLKAVKIAVDVPSGLPSDTVLEGEAFSADFTVSFQFPKLSLMFPEHGHNIGELVILDIGIDQSYFKEFESKQFYLEPEDIKIRHKKYHRASHKGDYGKVMLIGGSLGKVGAVYMASKGALRTGSGLVSAFVPKCGLNILQASLPEVMVEISNNEYIIDALPENMERFDAIGIGPGKGTDIKSAEVLQKLMSRYKKNIVIDADAINIIAQNEEIKDLIRDNMILTPHVMEFERLVGKCIDHTDRLKKAIDFCAVHKCILILKGPNTTICMPDGRMYFNSTGTKYLATGGTGDVLTGILTSFIGQGYSAENAAICGVYHHGLAGQLASVNKLHGTIATDIIDKIPETFYVLNHSAGNF